MAKKLDEQTKVRIAMLHSEGIKHLGIQKHLGICRSTVCKYKNYKPPKPALPRHKPTDSYKCSKCGNKIKLTDYSYKDGNLYYALKSEGVCEDCAKMTKPTPSVEHSKLELMIKNIDTAADIIRRIDLSALKTPIAPEPIKLPITMTVTPQDLFTAWNRLALLAKVTHIEIGG